MAMAAAGRFWHRPLPESTIIKENPMKFVKLLSDWSVLTKVMANGHDLATNLESQGIY